MYLRVDVDNDIVASICHCGICSRTKGQQFLRMQYVEFAAEVSGIELRGANTLPVCLTWTGVACNDQTIEHFFHPLGKTPAVIYADILLDSCEAFLSV
jgi:hypothetical protein